MNNTSKKSLMLSNSSSLVVTPHGYNNDKITRTKISLRRILPILTMLAICVWASTPVEADIVVSYYEDGTSLKFDWLGSWDTDPILAVGSNTYNTKLIRSSGVMDDFYGFNNGYSRIANNITYTQTLGNGTFANDFGNKYATGTGDTFAIDWVNTTNVFLYAPINYVAGTLLSGSIIIPNTSILSVGLANASYDFGNHGEVHFRAQAVPEPSIRLLLGISLIGLAGVGAVRKIKRKAVDKS